MRFASYFADELYRLGMAYVLLLPRNAFTLFFFFTVTNAAPKTRRLPAEVSWKRN